MSIYTQKDIISKREELMKTFNQHAEIYYRTVRLDLIHRFNKMIDYNKTTKICLSYSSKNDLLNFKVFNECLKYNIEQDFGQVATADIVENGDVYEVVLTVKNF